MESKYTSLVSEYKDKAWDTIKSGKLSDDDLVKVIGGVGGANEATCEVCGKASGNYILCFDCNKKKRYRQSRRLFRFWNFYD